jgi:hypothetical protein
MGTENVKVAEVGHKGHAVPAQLVLDFVRQGTHTV